MGHEGFLCNLSFHIMFSQVAVWKENSVSTLVTCLLPSAWEKKTKKRHRLDYFSKINQKAKVQKVTIKEKQDNIFSLCNYLDHSLAGLICTRGRHAHPLERWQNRALPSSLSVASYSNLAPKFCTQRLLT